MTCFVLQIFEWVKEHGGEPIIPFSGVLESKVFDMPDDEKATYLKEVRSKQRHHHGMLIPILNLQMSCNACLRWVLALFLRHKPADVVHASAWPSTTNIVRPNLHSRVLFLELLGVLVQHEAVSALPKIITTGFRSIQLIYFFTAGEDEVKCWQIRKGTKAPQVCNGAAYFSLSQENHGFWKQFSGVLDRALEH